MAGRPTHNLCIKRKDMGDGSRYPYIKIGVGWYDEDTGSLGLQLEDGSVLDWRMKDTHTMILFRNERVQTVIDNTRREKEDDIPF